MDIGEVARRTGLRASALRFYESKGLIRSESRSGARRQFAPDVLDRLALVALGRAAGLSLDEIGGMLRSDGALQVDRAVLQARAAEFDRRIRQLTTMRDGLLHAAACKAEDHLACPKFMRLLRVASASASVDASAPHPRNAVTRSARAGGWRRSDRPGIVRVNMPPT